MRIDDVARSVLFVEVDISTSSYKRAWSYAVAAALVPEWSVELMIVNAHAPDAGVMGVRHAVLPIHGVQFHPESIATEHGHALLANFMALAGLKVNPLAEKVPA